jgi:hypothetical protein
VAQGVRIPGVRRDVEPHLLRPGEYGRFDQDGVFHGWHGIPAGTDPEDWMCANLSGHEVEEHEDGTITVKPSILIGGHNRQTGARKEWHGYLERGIWRQV